VQADPQKTPQAPRISPEPALEDFWLRLLCGTAPARPVGSKSVAAGIFDGTDASEAAEVEWSRGRELNPRPTDYESRLGANSAEPREANRAN